MVYKYVKKNQIVRKSAAALNKYGHVIQIWTFTTKRYKFILLINSEVNNYTM